MYCLSFFAQRYNTMAEILVLSLINLLLYLLKQKIVYHNNFPDPKVKPLYVCLYVTLQIPNA